ncbi:MULTISPECIES: COG2426 family protein [Romboutsia]|uniref:COG2426 family protein n=1 Tax=Romboutsia TaxID=1501226 RepID=UPI00216F0ABF|nr:MULTISPECIES: small multi-drug export protein [Romboutsia]MCI9062724.1 small multi-drug export protein [Romboutsia sp.]MCI9260696.1 small multi-drug export protein [Romboutsia sp.]
MGYLEIMILAMLPLIELRGAIPIGIAMGLNPIGVYIVSVIGSTIVSIPLIFTFRHILNFFRSIDIFVPLVKKVDIKIESGMKRLKSISILGIILFIGIPLPTTGTWTAAAIASILKMRIKTSLLGVLIGNMMSGIIVSLISFHII